MQGKVRQKRNASNACFDPILIGKIKIYKRVFFTLFIIFRHFRPFSKNLIDIFNFMLLFFFLGAKVAQPPLRVGAF
jgi:hypothetical protein